MITILKDICGIPINKEKQRAQNVTELENERLRYFWMVGSYSKLIPLNILELALHHMRDAPVDVYKRQKYYMAYLA